MIIFSLPNITKTLNQITIGIIFLGELAQLKHNLTNVRQAVETVCRKEIEELKDKYNEKLTDMLAHIKNLDTELSEKTLLLNKAMR